ncbi:MAG: zinc ribbon domain-containing protein [Thermoplasmata archaeon]
MNRLHGFASTVGKRRGPARQGPNVKWWLTWGMLALVVLGFSAAGSPHSTPGAVHPPPSASVTSDATHGDLLVNSANSPFIITSPFPNGSVYYQQGNITVAPGGTLEVINTTISFEQFVESNGGLGQQTAFRYSFQDQGGVVKFEHSGLTTDLSILNPYPPRNFSATAGSVVSVNDSVFDFPGAIYAAGAGTVVSFYNSSVTDNADWNLILNDSIVQNDSRYAPTLTVMAGAHADFLRSSYLNYYADRLAIDNNPGFSFGSTGPQSVAPAATATWTTFSTGGRSPSAVLTTALLHPIVSSGQVFFVYNTTTNVTSTASASFQYLSPQDLAPNPVVFPSAPTIGFVNASLNPATIAEINAHGVAAFVAAVAAGQTTLTLNRTSGTGNLNIFTVEIALVPQVAFNMVVSGATITVADSTLDLNWTNPVGTLNATVVEPSYEAHKLMLESGAYAFLANVTVPYANADSYANSSIVVPDASSVAYIYRWIEIPVLGANAAAVEGASVAAFYSYDSSQSSNATVRNLNDLSVVNPTLASYVTSVAHSSGAGSYGITNASGDALLLLATGNITNASLPDGFFLGDYHIGVTVPTPPAVPGNWEYASLTAYSFGMSPSYTDMAGNVAFPTYTPAPPITLTYTPPSGSLKVNTGYDSGGTVTFSIAGTASIQVLAVLPSGGNEYALGQATDVPSGTYSLTVTPPAGMPSGTYDVIVTATVGSSTSTITLPGDLTVSGGASPSFFDQTILGLPLWVLLAIIAAVIVVAVALLLVFRRAARGKLVECGECGNLIPEDATRCPKCGAEFESALVRCSRCGSTIPANSQVCPECAATLLGSPDAAESDPERQAYADYVERFRAQGKKELAENYSEGAFWDWWKRQPSYLPFSQWKLQQGQMNRAGMTAPPAENADSGAEVPSTLPAQGTTPATTGLPPASSTRGPPPGRSASAPAPTSFAPPAPPPTPPPAAPTMSAGPMASADVAAAQNIRPCSNCGKEIPTDYLVCPFCGAVTR